MNAKTKTLLEQALKLPRRQQLELARQLLKRAPAIEATAEPVTQDELDARWAAFERGDDPGEEAFGAIEDVRRAINQRERE